MYDKKTRETAVRLVQEGMSPRQASAAMGGRPGHAIIRRWAEGYVPNGRRAPGCVLTATEKVNAVKRLYAGEHARDVAKELGCAPSSVLTWRRYYEEGGEEALRTRIDRFVSTRTA